MLVDTSENSPHYNRIECAGFIFVPAKPALSIIIQPAFNAVVDMLSGFCWGHPMILPDIFCGFIL